MCHASLTRSVNKKSDFDDYALTVLACDLLTEPQWDTCNSAIDTLVTAFTRSVHMFLGGEGPEPFQLKPHTQATLSKGLSKVQFAYFCYKSMHVRTCMLQVRI